MPNLIREILDVSTDILKWKNLYIFQKLKCVIWSKEILKLNFLFVYPSAATDRKLN